MMPTSPSPSFTTGADGKPHLIHDAINYEGDMVCRRCGQVWDGFSDVTPKCSHFNYMSVRQYCEQLGMSFYEGWVEETDALFESLTLDQGQVDALMKHHAGRVWQLFNPRSYSFAQRVGLAFHFLFGKNKDFRDKTVNPSA